MSENNLLFPHGVLTGSEVMIDCLDDNLRRLKRQMENVEADCLYWQPDAQANSIAVILWHMGRILDVFFHMLALGLPTEQQCWFRCGWAEQTGYDPRGIGRDGWGSLNDYTLEEVAAMPRYTETQLMGFIEGVYAALREFLCATPMEELALPSAGFEGRYTRYQVIMMALMDNIRHLGEIRLTQSLWGRAKSS
jgi:hypothetical protein